MPFLTSVKIGNERYPALTGIRAMGAMAVFFIHLPFDIGFNIIVDVIPLFFVLSGFLIFFLYYNDLLVKAGKLFNYFVNRFARIYPVYFLLVTIAILLKHDFRLVFLLKNYTLTHAFFHNITDRAIQPSWSITVEECFYLLAPFIMYLVRRYNYFVSLLFGFLLLTIALFISYAHTSLLHTPNFIFADTFFGHFFEFYCGIFLALVILKGQKSNDLQKGVKWTAIGCSGIAIAIGILIVSNNMNDIHQRREFIVVNNFILPVPVAILYYGLIREKSWVSYFLSTRVLGLLGRTSYAFYLVHTIVIEAIAGPFLSKYFVSHNLYVLAVFIFTQLVAFLIFILYEEPLNIFIRKKFGAIKHRRSLALTNKKE